MGFNSGFKGLILGKFHMVGSVLDGNKTSELPFFLGCCVVDIKCKKRTFKTALLTLMEQNQQLHADKIWFIIHYYSPTCFAPFCLCQGVIQECEQHIKVTIRITNRCDFLYYVFISFFSSFPYMFRAFMGPSSGVLPAVVFMLPFGGGDFGVYTEVTTTNQSADARRRST